MSVENRITIEAETSLKSIRLDILAQDRKISMTGYEVFVRLDARFLDRHFPRAFTLASELIKHPEGEYGAKGYLLELYLVHQQIYAAWQLAQTIMDEPVSFAITANAIAKVLVQTGNADKAMELIDRGLEQFPNDIELWYQKGFILKSQANSKDAEVSYRRAIASNASHWASYRGLAIIGRLNGDDVNHLENQTGLSDMGLVDTRAALAIFYQQQGKLDLEVAHLK